jgi:hypothetical protein
MASIPKLRIGTPLVTLEEVDEWRDDLRSLKKQQDEIGSKIRDLEARLAAADFFVRERVAHKIVDAALETKLPETKPSMPPTMQEAILRVIRKNPDGMEPKQISNVIQIDPDLPSKLKMSHPNYIYTVLMRLVQHGQVKKEGSIYKPA